MFYTIYKTTNLVNGKFYIGKHQTKDLDDDYMGSGNYLKRAIKKYGRENFIKEILEVYDTEAKMNLAEKILVVCDPEISYNICSGGHGGFGYINQISTREMKVSAGKIGRAKTNIILEQKYGPNWRSIISKKHQNQTNIKKRNDAYKKKYPNGHFLGKKHTNETKQIISQKNSLMVGTKNSQYGTCWITNGQENKKIKKDDLTIWIELGYYKGRILS